MTASASRSEILCLFRSLLRTSRQFADNNIKEYSKRRTIDGFRQNKQFTDPSSISAAFHEGKSLSAAYCQKTGPCLLSLRTQG